MDYAACLALQRELHGDVAAGRHPGTILSVEHPPVLTLGRNAKEKHLKFAEPYLRSLGVELHRIERGGEVTAHEPGQLVVYPVVRLADYGLMPRLYVRLLEDAVASTLARFGITAGPDPEHPGVWVGREKICAVGIRIKDRASMHGIALNVCNGLELFGLIVPCGIAGRGVTSVSRLLGRRVEIGEVKDLLTGEIQTRMRASVASKN
jgi:lipoate-protein ligase B